MNFPSVATIAKEVVLPAAAGVLGSLASAGLMLVPERLKFLRIDVVRAVGAYVAHNRQQALGPGLVIHLVLGVIFAYLYNWVFRYMGLPLNVISGALAGIVHGALIILLLAIFTLGQSPAKPAQRRVPSSGLAQVFAHVLYGAVVGLVISVFNPFTPWFDRLSGQG